MPLADAVPLMVRGRKANDETVVSEMNRIVEQFEPKDNLQMAVSIIALHNPTAESDCPEPKDQPAPLWPPVQPA